MVKAIFFDIDGTLVSFETHKIPQSTIDAVHEVRQKGVKVFIATGRPVPFIDNLGDLEYDGLMSVNGASCRTSDGTVILRRPVQRDDLERLIAFCKETPIPIAFASDDDVFLTEENDAVREVFTLLNVRATGVRPIECCLDMDVMQIIAFFTAEQEPQMVAEVISGCEAHRWHPAFADCIVSGVSKSTGIDAMIDYYGIDLSETMAFGDGGNDMSMLSHVAHGIAMGNASDEVKAVARYVTTSVDDDGIANVLKHIEDYQ